VGTSHSDRTRIEERKMKSEKHTGHSYACFAALITAAILIPAFAVTATAGTHTRVIYSFQGGDVLEDGPQASLVADAQGNLYGTNLTGNDCCGLVFELKPPVTAGADWTETVLYSFLGGKNDGAYPRSDLIFDKLGNLYGTTAGGGPLNYGTVFELKAPAQPGDPWAETVLYIFKGGLDGEYPFAGVIFDPYGNLYGTTSQGGPGCSNWCGTVYELSPPGISGGPWTEQVLYGFGTEVNDGGDLLGDLIMDRQGVVYGTTSRGGQGNGGTAFQLARKNGVWTRSTIYNFFTAQGDDGFRPVAGLTFDGSGNLFGTLASDDYGNGGIPGEIFELTPPSVSSRSWSEIVLYSFTGGKDGGGPTGKVIFDKAGNLYTTALLRGLVPPSYGNGTVVKLTPPTTEGGAWTETTLHDFGGSKYGDACLPAAGLTFYKGTLYGTAQCGGVYDQGAIFRVVP
jgi:uncharacterized repeat protein (TIGR03803 family)